MNETIGHLNHDCGQVADVRKNKRGKFYLMCPNCGQLAFNLPGGQEYILNRARMFGAEGEPVTAPEAETVTGDAVEVVTITTPKPEKKPGEMEVKNLTSKTPEPETVTEPAGVFDGIL